MTYTIKVIGPTTLQVSGDGCENFLIETDQSQGALAVRVADLLNRAHYAGAESAKRAMRAALALGVQP